MFPPPVDFTFQGTGYTEAHQEIAFLSRHPHSPSSSHITLSGRRQSIRVHRRAFPRCAMPATSKITFTNECHSFVSGQHTEGRVAPKRIPRPPNAFMLYRSDFLKRGAVPPEVEKRQQNLSRIAGQCWNMLPETEKAIWYGKAGVVRAERRARYPSHKTGPFHKDTNRLSAKDERIGSATNSGRSFGRSGTRRMQMTYCEGMFAALHDSKITSPTSQASLLSPTPASMSPSSTTASLSPLSLPQLLPPFISYTHPSMQNLSPTTFESSIIWKNKIGYLLDLSGFEMPQRGLRDLDTVGIFSFAKATDRNLNSFRSRVILVPPKNHTPHFNNTRIALQAAYLTPVSNSFRSFEAIQLIKSP